MVLPSERTLNVVWAAADAVLDGATAGARLAAKLEVNDSTVLRPQHGKAQTQTRPVIDPINGLWLGCWALVTTSRQGAF